MPTSYPFMFEYPEKRRHRLINLPEQIDRLSLRDGRSLEVFANPLLMEKILEEMECFDIQCLRKVSRDIRSCIDTLKPDPHIGEYSIKQISTNNFPETIEAFIFLRNLAGTRIWYRNREIPEYEDNSYVRNFVYCGDQLIKRVVNDFDINMKHQKSKMMKLSLENSGNMFELIGNVLKTIYLRVRWLKIKVDSESDIMNILPHLATDYIRISSNSSLNLSNVAKLDQWKNAAELEVKDCTIINSIQELNLNNFRKITIKVNSISTNDFIFLKEIATKSVDDTYFTIYYNQSSIDDNLYTSLPLYERVAGIKCTWYFPTSNPENFLQIIFYYVLELVRFAPINRDSVPDDILNALI